MEEKKFATIWGAVISQLSKDLSKVDTFHVEYHTTIFRGFLNADIVRNYLLMCTPALKYKSLSSHIGSGKVTPSLSGHIWSGR